MTTPSQSPCGITWSQPSWKHSLTFLGTQRRNRDWYEGNYKEIQNLQTTKWAAHQRHLAQPTCPIMIATFRLDCSTLQRKLRDIQNKWWNYLTLRIQLCADLWDKQPRGVVADASRLFCHNVSFMKTEVLHQPIPRVECRTAHVTIGNVEMESTLKST